MLASTSPFLIREAAYQKRTRLIFPDQRVDNAWQQKRTPLRRWEPWEELSFLLDIVHLYCGIWLTGDTKHLTP